MQVENKTTELKETILEKKINTPSNFIILGLVSSENVLTLLSYCFDNSLEAAINEISNNFFDLIKKNRKQYKKYHLLKDMCNMKLLKLGSIPIALNKEFELNQKEVLREFSYEDFEDLFDIWDNEENLKKGDSNDELQ